MVIRVEGLGKKYSLHHEQSEIYTALRDLVARQVTLEHAASEEEFWALKEGPL